MPLTKSQSEIWEAMNVGSQWILRTSVDPLTETAPVVTKAATPKAAPQVVTPKAPVKTAPLHFVKKEEAPKNSFLLTPNKELLAKAKDASWDELLKIVSRCEACPMAGTRYHTVFADGAPGCPLVIVGEAPGRDEDLEGIPFVGKSGQLLTKIIESVGLTRGKDVAIINVLKCRPPNNRDPKPEELEACEGFLLRQLSLLQPKVLLLAGRFAASSLLKSDKPLGRLRETVHTVFVDDKPVPTVVTYHPSYLLRSPVEKEKSWHDFVMVKHLLAKELNP